ncbi:MAG TPA: D-alanine--D-alanine ligase [Savagea sp.]
MKTTIGLIYGGKSAEHDVSISTAYAVMQAVNFNTYDVVPVYITIDGGWVVGEKRTEPFGTREELVFGEASADSLQSLFAEETLPFDLAFPVLHGTNGEDGTIQGLFEVLNIPYVGNGVLASSAGMDKVVMKQLFEIAGLPQVAYVHFVRHDWETDQRAIIESAEQTLPYPMFVKPANLGSSVGISKADDRDELIASIELALKYDRKIVIERGVEAREIEVAVLGNEEPKLSVPGEIRPIADFYDYEAKYQDDSTELVIPAHVTDQVKAKMEEMAFGAYRVLDCSGLVRADFFVTDTNEVFINEVNTMPGFTPKSMFPLLWQETGVAYETLIEQLIELALERHAAKQQLQYTVE